MSNLSFNEGYKEFTINGDESRKIRINTSDLNLMKRIVDLKNGIKEKEKMYKGLSASTNPENVEKIAEELLIIEQEVRKEVDEVFNAPICDTVFGNLNCMSPAGGVPIVWGFLNALIPEIEKTLKSEKKKMEKYTEKVKEFK